MRGTLSGCIAGAVLLASCRATPPPLRATAWPEADALFRRDPAWRGADSAYSIALGGQRVLWLFGDSFVGPPGNPGRKNAAFVRNTAALQTGLDPATASLRFLYGRDAQDRPSAFMPGDADGSWYWPGHGARVGDGLITFWVRMQQVGEGAFGFRAVGSKAVLTENPDDAPELWRTRELPLPENGLGLVLGFGAVLVADGHLYDFAPVEPGDHDVYLVRWSLADAVVGELAHPSWWLGAGRGFRETPGGRGAEPVFRGGQSEFGVCELPGTDTALEFQAEGFGGVPLVMRTAPRLAGPWSEPRVIHRPAEARRPGVLIYSAKVHPWASGGALVLTYCTNHTDLATLVADESLYYPRFLRLERAP